MLLLRTRWLVGHRGLLRSRRGRLGRLGGTDFQCRKSCTGNLCRLGGLGSHDGLGVGHDGPPAIVPSIIAYITAVKGLNYYVARVTTAR